MSTIAALSVENIPASSPLRRATLAAGELLLVIAALEICVWEVGGPWHDAVRWIAGPVMAIVVIAAHRRRTLAARTATPDALPDARDTAAGAWLKTLAVTVALALLIPPLALATRIDGEGFRLFWLEKGTFGLVRYLAGKGAFIVVQQWLLQYFLLPACLDLVPQRRAASGVAALLFGLVHLPSLLLVGITAIAGYCWLGLFARGRRIAPLAVSHLALAVLAHATLPERLTLNMRVGASAQEVAQRYRVLHDPQLAAQAYALCSDDYYAACGGTADGFLAGLYCDVLQRAEPPSAESLAAWREKLAAQARADIVVEFLRCEEFQNLPRTERASRVTLRVAQRLDRTTIASETSQSWR